MRLDKFLSHSGFGSRKEVKSFLKKHLVLVNGSRETDGKIGIDEQTAQVTVDGQIVVYQQYFYYLLHKPKGVISATEDRVHQTVLDLLAPVDYRADLFPVGRLDKDTTGLLIITNDGQFSHELLAPKKKVPKCYYAEVNGIVTLADQALLAKGIMISGEEWCQPSKLEILKVDQTKGCSQIRLTITEGKYHQVKRMVEALGKQVTELHRESLGTLSLEAELLAGMYRPLTEEERTLLMPIKE